MNEYLELFFTIGADTIAFANMRISRVAYARIPKVFSYLATFIYRISGNDLVGDY